MIKFSISKEYTSMPEYLFYFFVFLLPWQTRWIARDFELSGVAFEYGRISLYGFDIILMAILLYYYITKEKKTGIDSQQIDIRNQISARQFPSQIILERGRRLPAGEAGVSLRLKIRNLKPMVILILFGGYVLASVIWADEKLISIYWAMRLLLGIGLFWAAQKINFSKLRLAVVAAAAGFIQGLLAVWQSISQTVWAAKWLGMASQKAGELGASVIENGGDRWLRAYGSMSHPNILGGFLTVVLLPWFYLLLKTKNRYQKVFVATTGLLILAGIFFSFSRAAWIIFVVLYLAGWFYFWKNKQAYFFKKILVSAGALIMVLAVIFWPLVNTRSGLSGSERLEVKSTTERVGGYRQAIAIIKENPFFGVGAGNYVFAARDLFKIENPREVQPAHNVYLLLMAELGAVGFLAITLLCCYLAILLIKRRRWLYFVLLLVMGGLMFFDHFWWTTGSGMYVLWLIIGLAWKEADQKLETGLGNCR